jgi:putative ABC transport system permease protein
MFSTDIRYALRGLLNNRGFAAVVILTLALGVGANTAIFSVVRGVLLRPLPYGESDNLVTVWENNRQSSNTMGQVSPPNFADWRAQSSVFDGLAAAHYWNATLAGEEGATRSVGAVVTSDMLSAVLRVPPAIGRPFTRDDVDDTAESEVILSHELWMREFGGDPDLLESTLLINGSSLRVVGIMPPGFRLPLYPESELWRPLRRDLYSEDRSSHYLRVVGRVRSGLDVEQARAEMATIMARLELEYPEHNADTGVNVVPLRDYVVGDVSRALFILLGAVGFVLLIACANVVGLFLARGSVREREFAMRAALGASRARLARQVAIESLLLAALGGAAGLALAFWGVELLLALGPGEIPRLDEIGIDGLVLGFTLVVAMAAGLVVGTLPAIRGSRATALGALRAGGVGRGMAREAVRARRALAVVQVATALVLVGGACLLIRSFGQLVTEDVGFEVESLVTARISLSGRYSEGATRTAFLSELLDRLGRHDEARSVAASLSVPFGSWEVNSSFAIVGRPPPEPNEEPDARIIPSTPGYFRTMGIPLVRGRDFSERDGPDAAGVIVINEQSARLYWPGEDPIGQRIHLGGWDPPEFDREIIGIASDVRFYALDQEPTPEIYLPYQQMPVGAMNVVARVAGDPSDFVRVIRADVHGLDRAIPVYNAATMTQMIGRTAASERFYMVVLGIFAAVAAALAAVGIYGVLSYSVAQQSSEIGVRMALGASPRAVLGGVIADGYRMVSMGLALGLLGWVVMSRLLVPLLHEVSTADVPTILGTVLLMTAITLLASYVPARRAMSVNPMTMMRSE